MFHNTNKQKVLILGFLIFLSILPFLWLFTQMDMLGGFIPALANISGLIGATFMLWQFVLGIRFISRKLTPDYISLTRFHIFLGLYGMALVFMHPFLETTTYGIDLLLSLPDISSEFSLHVTLGRIAFSLFIFVWFFAAFLRKKVAYRYWLYTHYLTYPILALVFLHAREIGTFINSFSGIQAYWLFLTAVFGLIVLWRVLKYANVGKASYRLHSKKTLESDITEYTFKPIKGHLHPNPGQFAYIRKGFFSEAHPFSIMRFNQDNGHLTFAIKAVGRYTNQLESLTKGDRVFLDGPYGVFTKEGQNAEPKIIIAGGIGVTPFVELVNRFGDDNTFMFYCNRTLSEAVNRDEFIKELGDQYIDAVSREKVKKKTVIQGRLDRNSFLKYVSKDFVKSANIFICGSPAFMASVQKMLSDLDVPKTRTYSEEFSL